ncbi:MAG TPA: cupredoxin domain-containing protein [Patescibacteria group bacterium]|nr:cupredoxin domain-containing protein [Patescibacteria group bacterium]
MIASYWLPVLGAALGLSLLCGPVWAEDAASPITVTLKDHQFSPAEIHIPTGKPAFLHVVNQDATPEEFEVRQLAIEKVISAGGSGEVRLRPLGPGQYSFMGEFHADTAHGVIVVE